MIPKLSILIPALVSRMSSYKFLINEIERQAIEANKYNGEIESIYKIDSGEMSIGEKRNFLLEKAKGEYVCFIDDDDIISSTYIKDLFTAIEQNKDCCSLMGVITTDNQDPQIFEHSIKYPIYCTNDTGAIKFERYPNHLNAIKSSIAKQFKFPEINHGEDTDWATQIKESGLIKTEAYIPNIIYHYQYVTNK